MKNTKNCALSKGSGDEFLKIIKILDQKRSENIILCMNQIRPALIPCETSPGMFSNEYAVAIHLPTGEIISLFADKSLVEKKGEKTYLKVGVMEKKQEIGHKTAILPTESFEKGSRWLDLPSESFAFA